MLRRSAGHGPSPLLPFIRHLGRFLPLVGGLGLLASLLEGAGIGLFVPLIALLLSSSGAPALPAPLATIAALFAGYEPQTRAAILAGAIFALILLKGVVQAANDSLAAYAEGRISSQIRRAVASKLLELDYPFFLQANNTRLSHIVATDCWFVQSLTRAVLMLIPAAAGLLMFAVLLAWLNLKLFLIVLVGGGVVQAALRLFDRRQKQLSSETIAHNQLLWDRMLTLVHAPRVIRVFDQQSREEARTASAIEQLSRNIVASQTVRALVQPAMEALMALLFLVVLVAGFWSGMSVTAITVFLLILSRAQPHAKTITTAYFSIISLRGSIWEIEWLLSQPSPQRSAVNVNVRIDRDIRLENLSYVYPDGSRVLDGLTATIPVGKATALMGESGSGKTTVVNLLVRLLEPQSGKILLGDRGIGQLDLGAWRRRVAIAGQDSELVTGTVYENIAYARPDASMAEIVDAVRAAGAESFIAELPRGFDTRLGPNGFSLSGGQRQRIGLARALLTHPDLLILDEATNAVDAATEAEIMTRIAQGAFCRTLIVISHRKLTLGRCQYGIVLDEGRVSETGALGDLSYYRDMAGETPEND